MRIPSVSLAFVLVLVGVWPCTALSDFTAGLYDVESVRIGAYTSYQPILGFTLPCSGTFGDDTLKALAIKSYIERPFSIKAIRLWVETNHLSGFQVTDSHYKTCNLTGDAFQTSDTIVMTDINRILRQCEDGVYEDTFYLTVQAHTDSVGAYPGFYHGHGLEVVLEPGYIHLGLSSGEVNTNRIANSGYHPGTPPWFDPFKLTFDTEGPIFAMSWSHEVDYCKPDTIDQSDSLCISADTTGSMADPGNVIAGNVTLDLSPFGLSSAFPLSPGASVPFESCFVVLDEHIVDCMDVDSGFTIGAIAEDSLGNKDTVDLYFDKPIDTCKPQIDSIQFYLAHDADADSTAEIGDSLGIVVWGLSNADFEIDSVVADLTVYFPNSPPSMRWQRLDDVTNNNRLFRKKFVLEEGPVYMNADDPANLLTIWAWDNACNYDTLQEGLDAKVNLCGNPCGDANGDYTVNIGDVIYLVDYLFKFGPAPTPLGIADANCDGVVRVGDIVYLVNYLYHGGPEPCC